MRTAGRTRIAITFRMMIDDQMVHELCAVRHVSDLIRGITSLSIIILLRVYGIISYNYAS